MMRISKFLNIAAIVSVIGALIIFFSAYLSESGYLISNRDLAFAKSIKMHVNQKEQTIPLTDIQPEEWDVACIFHGYEKPSHNNNLAKKGEVAFVPEEAMLLENFWGLSFYNKEKKIVHWYQIYNDNISTDGKSGCLKRKVAAIMVDVHGSRPFARLVSLEK